MRFPEDSHRHSIVGRTGSGKTQCALWHLSHRNFHLMPWFIYDFKGDESINAIDGAIHVGIEQLPTEKTPPGLYVVHPHPDDEALVSAHLRRIWELGHIGVYIDEGYMMGMRNKWFRALLIQGRSKKIPMIILSQRPSWMDRYVFSESEFFNVFHLQHEDDRKQAAKFVPGLYDSHGKYRRLPEFHSYYYNLYDDTTGIAKPVPDIETILATFRRRLKPEAKKVV